MAEGVAHAPDDSVTARDSRADCDTGGEERRPNEVVKLLIARNIATSPGDAITLLCGELITEPLTSKGDHCSEVFGPPSFPSLSWIEGIQRRESPAN